MFTYPVCDSILVYLKNLEYFILSHLTRNLFFKVNNVMITWIAHVNCAQKVSAHLQIVRYIKNWNIMCMECIHEKRSFLLRILTSLPLLCNVVWLSYNEYSNELRSNFKSCKSPYIQSSFKRILAHASQKTLKLNGRLFICHFWKSTLSHSITHNSANQ